MNQNQTSKYWIFVADVHAGDTPGGLPVREEDIYNSFQELCTQAANDPNCYGILGGGDLRDKPVIQTKNLDGFNRGIEILHDAGKVIITIIGNHDMTSPTWVEAMHHPGLKSLCCPKTLAEHGIDPETTLASDFKNRNDLRTWLESIPLETRKNAKTVILHLALADLCAINQKAEISLEELKELGFGANGKVTLLIGDVHNYGDIQLGNIEAVYPGSIEMTDRNEGVNGFKSARYPTERPEFAKFVIHWYPNGKSGSSEPEWERIPLPNYRPWYYVKISKTKEKNTTIELELALKAVKKWDAAKPGILNLILPEKELENAKAMFQPLKDQGKILYLNFEIYEKEIHGLEDEEEPPKGGTGSWDETKSILPEMAGKTKMSPRALALLNQIIVNDKTTSSVKNDVATAWKNWKEEEKDSGKTKEETQPAKKLELKTS